MDVIKISPRGYCYGVVDAIQLAKRVAADPTAPRPVYILGQIVHNQHVVAEMDRLGIISLDGPDRLALLERVESGTVIFTAHGVSPLVKDRAAARGLNCVDATCPDVERTHELIRTLVPQGYQIVYVGKRGHPEPEGAIGEAPDAVHLVETVADVATLEIDSEKLAVTNQTTLSKWDTQQVIDAVRARYPHAEVHNEICLATQQRQEAAVFFSQQADLVLVVGDKKSNNTNRLVEVVQKLGRKPAYRIDTVDDIRPEWLEGVARIGVTAGSSTPSELTRAVIRFLESRQIEVNAAR
ncbi:MAG: 4-hydroxy-3-methylbut-2-enyl diphosphate reductase [Dehalococcoidia bacterium]